MTVHTFFLLLGFLYLAMEENFSSTFRQLVHHRVPGQYEGMLFPTLSKTWNSLAGIGVGLIALEWLGKGRKQILFLVLNICQWCSQTKFPRSTFFTLAISALREIIRPWQTYLFLVFPFKQQIFAIGNFPSENAKASSNAATINTNFMPTSNKKFNTATTTTFVLQKIWERKTFTETVFNVMTLSGLWRP